MTDHDQLFKQILKAFFAELIELIDPILAAELRSDAVKFLDKETFSEIPQGERAIVDLVGEVPTRAGKPQLILVHVEIEGEFRTSMAERLWLYYIHLRLNQKKPVVPIVLTLSGGPPGVTRPEWVEVVLGHEVCRFRYYNFGLSGSLAEEYLNRPQPLAWGLAALMRSEIWDPVEQKIRCLQAVAGAEVNEREEILLLNLVETYLELQGPDAERFDSLKEQVAKEVGAMELTWAGKIEKKGREQGRLDGARSVLIRLLEHRFGPLPGRVRNRVESLDDPQELELLSERLLDAKSLADLELSA